MAKSITSTFTKLQNASKLSASESEWGNERSLQKAAKRLLDLAVSVAFLALFLPLFCGFSAILLVVQGRPILFRHTRIGRGGQTFKCFKFRTMVNNAGRVLEDHLAANPAARLEWETTQKLKNDPRVTALGQVMRKLSIDELPQILNVIRGEMSLVGPRPIVSAETRFYGHHLADYQSVRPGITGLWQVSGRSNVSYGYRVELDVEYVRNWSLIRDLVILVRTIPAVLTADGSC